MASKTETVYAPFSFMLTDLLRQHPVHEGQEGHLLVFKDKIDAYEQWDKLKNITGPKLSAYGAGPDGDQHVYMPTCTGMLKLEIPRGLIGDEFGGKRVCIMSDNIPAGPNDVKLQSHWIQQVDIRIEGDVAHGPILHSCITGGEAPEYSRLSQLCMYRMQDLSRICSKLAADPDEARMRADLHDEFARDSLRAMYCGNGFVHRRVPFNGTMSDAQQALSMGLSYLKQYMHSMEGNLGIDAVLRHAHSMEQEFRDIFPEHYKETFDRRIAEATAVAQIMGQHAENTVTSHEKTVFLSLKATALRDAAEFTQLHNTPSEPQSQEANSQEAQQMDDVGDSVR